MLTNISSHTHSTTNICNDLWVIQSVIISQEPFTPLKNRTMCLIRSHALTARTPTLTIVVIQSDLSYCQVFSSAYFLYIFLQVSVLSCIHCCQMTYASCSFGYSFLDNLFINWLFPCLVVLRVSVFYIANWMLVVWICVRNHNLVACHFYSILYNYYISVICLDLCQKSLSGFLVSAKRKPLKYCASDLSIFTLCFSKFFIQVLYNPYILHCRMFALTIYHRYFAKIFVNFMWFSVKNKT